MFRSIVVPLDLEHDGDHALPLAGALATEHAIPIELITVSSPRMPEASDRFELATRARELGPNAHFTLLHDNDVAGLLVREIRDRPDALTVMATRGRGLLTRPFLGSVSEALLARLHRPVLLIGPAVDLADLSPERTLVVGVASDFGAGALVDAVSSWRAAFGGPAPWLVTVRPRHGHQTSGDDVADTALGRVARELTGRGVPVNWDIAHSRHPAEALEEFAGTVPHPVVVLGSERWVDPRHAPPASVIRQLAHSGQHPILVVPAVSTHVSVSR